MLWLSLFPAYGQAPWKITQTPTSATLRGVCFADGFGGWYVVGDAGTILASEGVDGWVIQASGTTSALLAITYGSANPRGGSIVAVGADGTIITKGPDSNGWTLRMSGTQVRLTAVALGPRAFLAVGDQGTALTSSDTINWTRQDSGTTENFGSVAYGNGRFVVAAKHPMVFVSADNGVSFQRHQVGPVDQAAPTNAVTFGSGRFYVSGSNGVYTSTDGESWNWIGNPMPVGATTRGAVYFDNALLTIGDGGLIRDEHGNSHNLGAGTGNWLGGGTSYAGTPFSSAILVGTEGKLASHPLPLIPESRTAVANLAGDLLSAALDPSFRPALNAPPDSVLPLADGRIYVAGTRLRFTVGGRTQAGIARLNADGSIDTAFAAGAGLDFAAYGPPSSVVLVAQPDGKIVAFVGVRYGAYSSRLDYTAAARFNPDGSRDPAFQPASSLRNSLDLPVLLADGRWLLCTPAKDASGNRIIKLERFTRDALTDASFGTPTLTSPIPANVPVSYYDNADPWNKILIRTMDARGRIYLVTSYGFGGYIHGFPDALQRMGLTAPKTLLFRLNADGTPDTTFPALPLAQIDALGANESGLICQQTSWDSYLPLATGTSTLQRLRFDGTPDPSFVSYSFSHSGPALAYPTFADNGTTYVLTSVVKGHRGVLHFDATGAYDSNFSIELGDAVAAFSRIIALPNGQLLALGQFDNTGSESSPYLVRIKPDTAATANRLTNLSVRASAGSGDSTLIAGYIVRNGSKRVLARGIGPALTTFGVEGVLADPVLTLYNGAAEVSTNDDWGAGPASLLADTANQLKAFSLPAGSRDAALITTVDSGPQTLLLTGKDSGAGVALVELYDTGYVPLDTKSARFTNLSARAKAGLGADTLIAGFILQGTRPRNLLLRAVGPGLAKFGVSGFLPNPVLTVFSGATPVARNDNWGDSDREQSMLCREATLATGAFPLEAASLDAAMLVTITPGSYTVQVSGSNNLTGIALLEIYEVP